LASLAERAVDTKVAVNGIMLNILRKVDNSLSLAFVAWLVLVGEAAAAVTTWA
jgi:hypothetical protein